MHIHYGDSRCAQYTAMGKSGVEEWLVQAVMAPWWAMMMSGVEDWLRRAVMALYSGVRTMVGHEEVRCGAVAGTSSDGIV